MQKKDISLMSADELSAYVEKVRAKRRERAKHYYDNVIKNDPEKYANTYIYIMMIALYCSCRNKYMYKYIAFVARRGQMPQHQHPNALVGKLLMPLLMHIFWLNAATLKADTRNTTGACMGAARPRQRR